MNEFNLEEKLTPAAKQALDELVSDYRNQILLGAQNSARSISGEIQEISVHDILSGINRRQLKRATSLPRTLEFGLQLYAILGLVMGAVGIFYYLSTSLSATLNSDELISLAIGVLGLLISLISFSILRLRQSRPGFRTDTKTPYADIDSGYAIEYVIKWQEVELSIRNTFASRLGESSAKEPISILISKLKQEQILSNNDVSRIKDLLKIRNKVLHSGFDLTREQFKQISRDSDRILLKLKAINNK